MAITTAQDIVILKSPETPLGTRLDDLVELAGYHIAESTFGTRYNYALALMVLHWLTLEAQAGGDASTSSSGAVGGITGKKEGQLSINYGGMASSVSERNAYLMSTQFGQELKALWDACIFMPRNRFVSGA